MKKVLSLVLVFAFAASAHAFRHNSDSGSSSGTAAQFSGYTVDGDYISLSDFSGKVVFVNYWATWCYWCTLEIPDMIELQDDYADDLVIIGVSADYDAGTAQNYADSVGLNYDVVMDYEVVDNSLGYVSGYPTTFIIDGDGSLVETAVGYRTYSEYEDILLDYKD